MSKHEALIQKVLAYITRPGPQGLELLTFTQPMARHDAGLQVPAGTVEPGEEVLAALYREVEEECGLKLSAGAVLLGQRRHPSHGHLRHYFHLNAPASAQEYWEHIGTGNGDDRDWLFCCRFLPLGGITRLAGRQGEFLSALRRQLGQ